MQVKDLMQTEVVTLHVADTLDLAEDIMRLGRIRHLPVIDESNHLVGVVTQHDLLKASVSSVLGFDRTKEKEWLGTVRVQDVMTIEVTTIEAGAGIVEAVDKLILGKFGCLPVVENNQLVGLMTETDCLPALSG